jgi:hypothetical protein
MKPIVLVCVVTACLLAGFAGASLWALFLGAQPVEHARDGAAAPQRTEASADRSGAPAAHPAASAGDDVGGLLAAVQDKLAVLEIEVASLREELARRESASAEAAELVAARPEALASLPREAIVRVMEEERQKEAAKREEERKLRELEALQRVSERAAKDLGLGPADQERLTTFLVAAGEKRDELFRGARDAGPEGFRTAFEELRTWREAELEKTFGKDLAQQLTEYQRQQRGDWGGMGGGWWQGGDDRGRGNGGDAQGGRSGRR